MSEKIDPYFEERLRTGRQHRVLRSIELDTIALPGAEVNKGLPYPVIDGTIEEFSWSADVVDNMIDALESGKIKISLLDGDRLHVELCPLKELPAQLGHVSELDTIRENLKRGAVFGSAQSSTFTYMQTVDFAVEGYMDDETEGKEYGRVYVDAQKLSGKRNVYIDPESLHVTEYEYGYSFCVQGGVPFEAIVRIDVIRAKKIQQKMTIDESDWSDDAESFEQQSHRQTERLREYLKKKL